MGTYLIPGATSTAECADFLPWAPDRSWAGVEGGVLFTDPNIDDAACAALYAGFTPSGQDDEAVIAARQLPAAIQQAIADFQTFLSVPNGTATSSQRDAILKDVIQVLRYLNRRIESG